MVEETKRTLRHGAIARRKLVDPTERAAAGARLVARLGELTGELPDGATVAAYVSMGSEIETRPLLDALLTAGCRVLVPRLGAGLDVGWGELSSTELLVDMDAAVAATPGTTNTTSTTTGGTAATTGKVAHHRPDEPEGETLPPESLSAASLILVPALAVDRSGTRLGRGGGWYDRALGHRSPGCPVFAVCWDWEVLDDDAAPLPREAHDLPVDGALTPGGVVRFTARETAAPACRADD